MIEKLTSQRVLVTGANGFIGPHVVAAFLSIGADVRAIAGPPGGRARSIPMSAETVTADVTDRSAMDRIVKGVGAVVHLAGPASVRESLEKPGDYFRVHVDGTATILEASRRAGILRFVYISSAEVYGRPVDSPVSEDYALQPRSPYGAAKVGAEFAVRAYVASFGMTAVILRPFSIYGPGSAVESLFGTIERQLRTSNNVELADLRPVRDYCYVGDLADATVRAIGSPLTGLTIINIGTGEGTSVSALAMLAAGVLNRRVTVSEDATARRAPATEIFELVADPRKAAEILGWTAKTPLADGLALTLRGGDVRRA